MDSFIKQFRCFVNKCLDAVPGRFVSRTTMDYKKQADPQLQRVYDLEEKVIGDPANWRKMSKPKGSTHLWNALLSADIAVGTHLIEIRETDMHGRVHKSQRVIRVLPAEAAAGD
ncbi:MAG: hypothetical protein ABI614_28100 [Planctomycetota bacterium]